MATQYSAGKKSGMGKKKKLTHIGQYEIGRTLGEGSFSKVKLGTDVFSGKKFAIKIVDWSLVDDVDDQTECVDREIKIMKLLDHPNIVKLYDIISHQSDKKTFLVLEYVSRGELFDYIVANGRIRESESRRFWRQLVSAVEYCHAFLVVHRDLKPSNLLLDDDGSIKITDFGLSNTMTPGKLFSTWCGSLYYSAPEIVEEKKYVGPAVDVWSMGVILYALLNGRLPWSGRTDLEKIRQIVVADMSPPDRDLSDACVDLICGCLTVDVQKRYTVAKLRTHDWTCDGFDGPPECRVPQTKAVAKVSEPLLEQLSFLGILDGSEKSFEQARNQIQNNEQTQVVFAYHTLLTKPQLLVSASFLPRDKIKRAVSQHRENQRAASSKSVTSGVDDSGPADPATPSPRAGDQAAAKQAELDDLNDLLGDMEAANKTSSVDALVDDLEALTATPPTEPAPEPAPDKKKKKSSHHPETRRRSRTVSAGSGAGASKPPKMAHLVLKKTMAEKVAMRQPAKTLKMPLTSVDEEPPAPSTASPQETDPSPKKTAGGTWTANLFRRNKKKAVAAAPAVGSPDAGRTANSTWDPALFAAAKAAAPSGGGELRTVKGVFKCATTSTRPPDELVASIDQALMVLGHMKYKRKSAYLFRCADKKSKVRMEIEVVNVEKLDGMHGIRFARLQGDTFLYKKIAEELMTLIGSSM